MALIKQLNNQFTEIALISLVAICILLSLFTVGLLSAVMDLLAFTVLVSYVITKKKHKTAKS